jgi:hypothetical protein
VARKRSPSGWGYYRDRQMPVWAAILIPLLTGLLAIGGGILGTYASGRLERERERRKLLAEMAKPFAELLGSAWDSLVYSISLADDDDPQRREEMKQAAALAGHLAGKASEPLAPVRLFFGSEVGKNAEQALAGVKTTAEHLQRASETADAEAAAALTRARKACRLAEEHQSRFYEQAGAAIWQARLGPRIRLPGRRKPPAR